MGDKKIKKLAEQNRGSRGIPPGKIKSMSKWIKLQEKIRDLVNQAYNLEQSAVSRLIDKADVICTTNSTSGSEIIGERNFDVVVIDEATQATEPSCLIPITKGSKIIMAGDHKQLPQGKYKEQTKKDSPSKENPGESKIVKQVVENLLDLGIDPEDIGIISPYNDQIGLLNKNIKKRKIEIKTVDGFQGREKDVIILSFVRSNDKGEVGFLKDLRRLNVSITRARKKLIIIGDSNTLTNHKTYNELINYIKKNGKYHPIKS